MFFVQRDDVVEDLAAAASDPAFRNPVLPRCLNTCALWSETARFQKRNHIDVEFRIVIQYDVTIRTSVGKGFAQLLHDPLGSRMAGDIEMQDSAAPVFNHEEAIEQLEGQCGHGEEVNGDDCLAMIGEEWGFVGVVAIIVGYTGLYRSRSRNAVAAARPFS